MISYVSKNFMFFILSTTTAHVVYAAEGCKSKEQSGIRGNRRKEPIYG